ncbi:Ndufb8, NADH dehydrogenase 19kDa subunit [Pisolithus tinctorius]|uniref:Uncharacterized protein n=1 Tax=Pisolithus tinctorius Marx 270 TaxID=870435 RepID=A0A0C3K1E9_PISTI|nr:Ndufb8, NADH dehydrogenase 19kDa subunit [Pisolithus tinctorius]KIO15243.1 hypothetical protein M404DRAFT_991966 [Pisolithus tinctorius Marx 270]
MTSAAALRLSRGALKATASLRCSRTASTVASKPHESDPQLAGYPELPWVSNQSLPARGWWDQQERRNFGDPVHEYEEVLSMWGPDIPHVPPRKALFQFSLAASGFIAFGLLCKYTLAPERPTVPREYPYSGLIRELGGLEENKAREIAADGDE